uniref:RNase H type-1 domain-containing protein n=1 Tax=Cannabis sativa TaxID=3483 RepID=A0A803NIT2_CANSA
MSFSSLTEFDGAELWTVPPPNSININVDGAIFEEVNGFGFGLVARGENGLFIEGRAGFFGGTVAVEVVEDVSIREALSWIKQSSWQQVYLMSDCLVAVQALRSSFSMISLIGDIIKDCKPFLIDLPFVKVYFVK